MVADPLTRPAAGPRQPRQEVAIMVRSMPWKLALIAVGALACLASLAGHSFADDEAEGIVRICDQVPGQGGVGGHSPGGSCRNQSAAGCPNCQPGHPCRSHCGSGYRNCGTYGYYGNGNCGYYGYGCMRPCGHVHQFLDWFNPHGMCTHSPDHGYAPPGKMHTPHPQQVAYVKGFPDSWTGQQGAGGVGSPRATSIYMPTDTTQLGYYYQAVPRWQPNPSMVPPTPIPSQWHRELCQDQGQGGCKQCRGGHAAGSCPHCKGQAHEAHAGNGETIISERVIDSEPSPAPVVDPQPQPIEVAPTPPVDPAPPAAPLEKAENLNLQPIN